MKRAPEHFKDISNALECVLGWAPEQFENRCRALDQRQSIDKGL